MACCHWSYSKGLNFSNSDILSSWNRSNLSWKKEGDEEMEDKTERRLLYLVRHGERIDEVASDWEEIAQNTGERIFDPPLTERGQLQAIQTGERINKEIEEAFVRGGEDQVTIELFSSPFKRCMQTGIPLSPPPPSQRRRLALMRGSFLSNILIIIIR